MAVIRQLSVLVRNERGALAELCMELASAGVNIRALMVPEEGRVAPIRLVVDDTDSAIKALKAVRAQYDVEEVLAVNLSNHPGALSHLTRRLAAHGIDVKYAYGSIVKGGAETQVILAVSDPNTAASIAESEA